MVLMRRLFHGVRCNPNLTRSSMKFSVKTEDTSLTHYYFPWIFCKPSEKGFLTLGIQKLYFDTWNKYIFNDFEIPCREDELSNFLTEAEMALRSAIEGVFHHVKPITKITESVSTSEESIVSPESTEFDSTLHLRAIFDKDLSTLFLKLLDTYKSKNYQTHDVIYDLQKIHRSKIINRELIIGATRSNMFDLNRCSDDTVFGCRHLIKDIDRDDGSMKGQSEATIECMNNGDMTVRFTVEFDCTELFSVTEKSTGKIIQGHAEPRNVTHKIILENTIRYVVDYGADNLFSRLPGKEDDWIIVDIDNWLAGNRFWQEYPPQHKKFLKSLGLNSDRLR